MPLYEYYCADCQDRFEVLTSYEAAQSGTIVCATCHGTKVRKLISVVAKRGHSDGDGDDFGDFGESSDLGDDGDMGGGSCGCGGACTCNN